MRCSYPADVGRASVVVGKQLERSLVLTNTSDKSVAFKVKTTAPKRYCVRPNSSVIKPQESIEVRILMQPLKELPPADQPFKDKFLVQSCLTDAETDDAKVIFDNADKASITDHKLPCTFNLPGALERQVGHESNESLVNATARDTLDDSADASVLSSAAGGRSIDTGAADKPAASPAAPAAPVAAPVGGGTVGGGTVGANEAGVLRKEQVLAERMSRDLKDARDREAALELELKEGALSLACVPVAKRFLGVSGGVYARKHVRGVSASAPAPVLALINSMRAVSFCVCVCVCVCVRVCVSCACVRWCGCASTGKQPAGAPDGGGVAEKF